MLWCVEMSRYKQSSREAYAALCGCTIERQEWEVIKAVRSMGICTRRMVADKIRMDRSLVSARVRGLLDKNALVETETVFDRCPVSGVMVYWIKAK